MAKKPGIFGRSIALAETALEKIESITYETLTTAEYGFKAITNITEEMHNDTMSDVLDSRMALQEKLVGYNERLKAMGRAEIDTDTLLISRR